MACFNVSGVVRWKYDVITTAVQSSHTSSKVMCVCVYVRVNCIKIEVAYGNKNVNNS